MKTCTKCKTPRPFSDFYKSKATKSGLNCWCKYCSKAAQIKCYAENGEKYKKRNSLWKKDNYEKARDTTQRWKKKNRKRVIEANKTRHYNLRFKALKKISNSLCCENCGCDKYELLEINHIKGNGNKERKGTQSGRFYMDIAKMENPTKHFNILCRPCNHIHYLEMLHGKLPYEIKWIKLLSGDEKKK